MHKFLHFDVGTFMHFHINIYSIQAEGSFAQIKQDMNFRRFMCRGQKNVLAESILLAMAHNINKLHSKIQAGRTGKHLFELKKAS